MSYLELLETAFRNKENPEKALQIKNYMRGQFSFFGLDAKTRRDVQRDFFKTYGYPPEEELFQVVFDLWELPERDFQHCALELLHKFWKSLKIGDIDSIERLIVSKSWWDTVDGLSVWICGSYFELYPEQIKPVTSEWMRSGNFWLQRSCLLFQLKYKLKTDTKLLESFIAALYQEKEFFIRKAIGWILREYSKTNPDWVREYIGRQKLSPLSYREAIKYL